MIKSPKKSVVRDKSRTDRCHRCGGLMVPERLFEIAAVDWRCVSCGERVDPVILAHRHKNVPRTEADKFFVGDGTPRLS